MVNHDGVEKAVELIAKRKRWRYMVNHDENEK